MVKKFIIFKLVFTMLFFQFAFIVKTYAALPLLAPVAIPIGEFIAETIIVNAARRQALTIANEVWIRQEVGTLVTQAATRAAANDATYTTGLSVVNGLAGLLGISVVIGSAGIQFNLDGSSTAQVATVSDPIHARPANVPKSNVVAGQTIWSPYQEGLSATNPGFGDPYSAILYSIAKSAFPQQYQPMTTIQCQFFGENAFTCGLYSGGLKLKIGDANATKNGISTKDCPMGGGITNMGCIGYPEQEVLSPDSPTGPTVRPIPIGDVPNSPLVSPDIKTQPLTPTTVAPIADKIAERLGNVPNSPYKYDPSNPIVPADVPRQSPASPAAPAPGTDPSSPAMPSPYTPTTVGDLISPSSPAAQAPQPFTPPATNPNIPIAQPATPEGTQPSDAPPPSIGLPTLQEPPSMKSILDPILNLMPSLRNFQVPAHSVVCPTFNYKFGVEGINIDESPNMHCQWAINNRDAMRAFVITLATIAVVFIFLGA